LKTVPVTLAPEIVALDVPEFVKVTVAVPVVPTLTFPKLTVDGLVPICPTVPVPLSGTVAEGSVPPDCPEISTLPDVAPAAVGANETVKFVLWPASSVIGVVSPVTANSDPVCVKVLTVTDSVPEFVSVTACFIVVPTDALPKLMTAGTVVKVALDGIAVPVRIRACGEPGTLSAKVMLPLSVAAAGGVNTTLNVRLWPASMDAVAESPLVPKPVPVTFAAVSARAAFPPLEIVTGCELDWPATTLVNVTEAGEIEKRGPEPIPETAT
jgi:hypothetical protein